MLRTFKYDEESVVLDKYTLVEASGTRTVYNWLQYHRPEALEREFVDVGFTIEGLYSDAAGAPFNRESAEFAVVARTCGGRPASKAPAIEAQSR